jgi:uncharacterized protein (TIGR03118 family)
LAYALQKRSRMKISTRWFATLSLLSPLAACADEEPAGTPPPPAEEGFYQAEYLTSDGADAAHRDTALVNPWGLAFGPDTYFVVANQGTASVTLYDDEGTNQTRSVRGPIFLRPPETGVQPTASEPGAFGPTGIVHNGGIGFVVAEGAEAAPSRFVFATTGGTLAGWNGEINRNFAITAVDNSGRGAVYTALTLGKRGSQRLLYAADFANGRVDVFDEGFDPVTDLAEDAFVDPTLPNDFAPFGIQEIRGLIYVAYAKPGAGKATTGEGLGYVSAFETDGRFEARVAGEGLLDAPWGMVRAPADFGPFGGALLVGNFGDGRITAFDPVDYRVLGQLHRADGRPIVVEGLWSLAFGNGLLAGDKDDLYITAGGASERHGLFAEIAAFE